MMPSIFGENLFDEFFNEPFAMVAPQGHNPLYGKHAKNLMKTDVRETEGSYELDIDLPGFKKDEITVEVKNGCLNISAAKGLDKEEKDNYSRVCQDASPIHSRRTPPLGSRSPRRSGKGVS